MNNEWFEYAACRGMDANDFMPVRGDIVKIRNAKKVCSTCPVMFKCRQYGLDNHRAWDLHGIFGGLTKNERKTYLQAHDRYLTRTNKHKREMLSDD